ncbi:NotI family restriction endonuclease [Plantactinospora sp. BB1]|uniref:NotI family restriction endonuclease n=1 Tax=Plantactinospora sp. BB1 TaxID=2071627 RepID=UPI000D15ADA5|nr:NotI family restriction endonuclease [Plantactinospora sp. BB1]AVT36242.1 hypothetical protein C6W10_06915 [Plantactinospora sp. BB1]
MPPGQRRGPRIQGFPIVEAFGYPYDSTSPAAELARNRKWCPFVNGHCEKYAQYRYGYCSVTYAANWDAGTARTYAVCDHRLDGDPIRWAVRDHFGSTDATLVAEVAATSEPRLSLDYVAFADSLAAEGGVDLIAIESQAIDLRGGGVGPAWRAFEEGAPEQWREYFSEEAKSKGRRDTVSYGINTGNVYKRLGTQVAVKGEYLREVNVPLYVVAQHTILTQLRKRVNFQPVATGEDWDITFVSFDYLEPVESNGRLPLTFVEAVRTTLSNYREALTSSGVAGSFLRGDLIEKVKRKALGGSVGNTQVPFS